MSLGESPTVITGIADGEVITLSAGQFIISETLPTKIFGDDFNFIWPKLRPGINKLFIDGTGKGYAKFTYRYPIKIGDCAIDVEALGRNPICEGDISGVFGSVDGITTLVRKNVVLVDGANNEPYSASVKDSYLHITESDSDRTNRVVLVENNTDALYEVSVNDSSFYLSEASNIDGYTATRENILLIDETNNTPYELIVKDNSPENSAAKDYNLYLSKI